MSSKRSQSQITKCYSSSASPWAPRHSTGGQCDMRDRWRGLTSSSPAAIIHALHWASRASPYLRSCPSLSFSPRQTTAKSRCPNSIQQRTGPGTKSIAVIAKGSRYNINFTGLQLYRDKSELIPITGFVPFHICRVLLKIQPSRQNRWGK